MQIVIDISDEEYEDVKKAGGCYYDFGKAIYYGTPLPKGHGRLIDENYLLDILQCEEYETCTWRNCSDCNREKCIKRHRVLDAPTVIEADKAESEVSDADSD